MNNYTHCSTSAYQTSQWLSRMEELHCHMAILKCIDDQQASTGMSSVVMIYGHGPKMVFLLVDMEELPTEAPVEEIQKVS